MKVLGDSFQISSFPAQFEAYERDLWFGGIAFYGIGDTITTVLGLTAGRVIEAGPLVGSMLDQFGLPGLFLVKGLSLLGFYAFWRGLRSPGRVGIPLALVLVGVVVTAWNCIVLAL